MVLVFRSLSVLALVEMRLVLKVGYRNIRCSGLYFKLRNYNLLSDTKIDFFQGFNAPLAYLSKKYLLRGRSRLVSVNDSKKVDVAIKGLQAAPGN